MSWMLRITVTLLMLFLLAPVLLVFPISFSADDFIIWPPSDWSLRWYRALGSQGNIASAFGTSVVLAAVVTVCSLAAAIPAAVLIHRHRFIGRATLLSFLTAPLLLPSIVLALAMLIVFIRNGLVGSWFGLALGHLVLTTPYALRVLLTTLQTLPRDVEDAAASLGARASTVFRRITLPLMTRGIVAASALCFLVSFDEVTVSLFLVGPQLVTLPVALFRYVEGSTDPLVAAVSVLLILGTLAIVLIIERAMGLRQAIRS
ncbi:ABC-type spermidine/putrescine transport system, permease component II [Agrobacterium tumefaciens str. Kerr 14]|uniref:ABC-type spermidine/putrescine transport system, permease component II n=1 Tax=Agrobacterium tumefaciens str. Kerr 14 TaxID=1183424 RepID=A0A1S7SAX6_AGRTU|nr:ABC transporter permease [Agrobacterium tumefaciens]CUX65618.1 ABC-type spermidine/putrescine transport system, permease component II [Agrobacterium tumefaciens str. Kerr 14]